MIGPAGVRRGARSGVLLLSLLGVAIAPVLSGCLATAAVVTTIIVVRMLTPYGSKLTIKAEEEPRVLYNKLVAHFKGYDGIKILTEDQSQRAFEAEWTGEEGLEEWVSLVVQVLPDETSELVIAIGHKKQHKKDYETWAETRVGTIMRAIGVEWKIAATDAAPNHLASRSDEQAPISPG